MSLHVGYGEEIITPELGIELSGYGYYLNRAAESVRDDIKAKAIFIWDNYSAIILVSCDLLGLTVEFSNVIRAQIAQAQNVNINNILLACTHTHTAPACMPLEGLGKEDAYYVKSLQQAIASAVQKAKSNVQITTFCYGEEEIDPIGFNRISNSLTQVDPSIKTIVFTTPSKKIYLLSYSCHPVVTGMSTAVSADWPGALAKKIESQGALAIVFQGCCGNINPMILHPDSEKKAVDEELAIYAERLADGANKAEENGQIESEPLLKVVFDSISLPLKVPTNRDEIDKIKNSWLKFYKQKTGGFDDIPNADKFVELWAKRARGKWEEIQKCPFLENIPLQAFGIGKLKLMAVPGEIFCEIGLQLQDTFKPTFVLGLAGGDVGYFPTKKAYEIINDYACYGAPQFYQMFPFTDQVEELLIKKCGELLTQL